MSGCRLQTIITDKLDVVFCVAQIFFDPLPLTETHDRFNHRMGALRPVFDFFGVDNGFNAVGILLVVEALERPADLPLCVPCLGSTLSLTYVSLC